MSDAAAFSREEDMYPPVTEWLRAFLAGRFRNADIDVRDTHASPLSEYIYRHGLQTHFESDLWQTFDIRVDVTGFIKGPSAKGLAFVECKTRPISLAHISQLLGYSRVALPIVSYLVSPAGISGVVKALILRYDRSDILEYAWPKGRSARRVILARWDHQTRALDSTTILPPGS
jgi:hypothetical protein